MARRPKAAPKKSAYERRIEKYLASHPGATRQQARGHKVKEHVERKEHEKAKYGGLTKPQHDRVVEFAKQQSARANGRDADPTGTIDRFLRQTREQGYDAFTKFRHGIQREGAKKRQRLNRALQRKGTVDLAPLFRGRERAEADMQDLLDDFGFDPEDDFELAYYH
jgi:hypothetical protein